MLGCMMYGEYYVSGKHAFGKESNLWVVVVEAKLCLSDCAHKTFGHFLQARLDVFGVATTSNFKRASTGLTLVVSSHERRLSAHVVFVVGSKVRACWRGRCTLQASL